MEDQQMKVFKFYADAGHGWLAVRFADVRDVGLALNSFTEFSHVGRDTIYLEEDLDAQTFVNAHNAKYGETHMREVYRRYHHRIRNLPSNRGMDAIFGW
jgi:hypothetical protein